MFACSGAYFQDLPDSADILINQRNDFRVCDCVVRSAFPDLYISQVRSAAGAYDSGAGSDITKALPLAIDQTANQRYRKRGVQGKSGSVRVALVGRRIIKKQQRNQQEIVPGT